ncbi:acyl-CoA dehydrogenase-related protein [Dorcoceras hygrometricum]|uniref:Acyl-CoA dehydrogenase-related protein n=1 Tax=Dorcoceras hygrometricum TaxID=472368 RepID=A0A2Z7AXC2_9LAMI|nr:acyl-CoA dehydrogenase-related protein [Dorcoceras hygrometricum]
MSLFDLQDVCIAIGSLATLDLPMVVDLIGIYGLKGPYCTLTMTNWFLQALSVIPRGSWRDVARRFTMIRWCRLIGGRSIPVVDLTDDLPPPTVKSQSPCDSGWSQAPVASKLRRRETGSGSATAIPTSARINHGCKDLLRQVKADPLLHHLKHILVLFILWIC